MTEFGVLDGKRGIRFWGFISGHWKLDLRSYVRNLARGVPRSQRISMYECYASFTSFCHSRRLHLWGDAESSFQRPASSHVLLPAAGSYVHTATAQGTIHAGNAVCVRSFHSESNIHCTVYILARGMGKLSTPKKRQLGMQVPSDYRLQQF